LLNTNKFRKELIETFDKRSNDVYVTSKYNLYPPVSSFSQYFRPLQVIITYNQVTVHYVLLFVDALMLLDYLVYYKPTNTSVTVIDREGHEWYKYENGTRITGGGSQKKAHKTKHGSKKSKSASTTNKTK
jgi:hypothetical protein